MRIAYKGDIFLSGREAARFFEVSVTTFFNVYAPHLSQHEVPGYKNRYFRMFDLERYEGPRTISRRRKLK
jgi:hypothetical protein